MNGVLVLVEGSDLRLLIETLREIVDDDEEKQIRRLRFRADGAGLSVQFDREVWSRPYGRGDVAGLPR